MPDVSPELDPELAALRDTVAASGAPPMVDLSPAEVRERVTRGNGLCSAGPPDVTAHDAPISTAGHAVAARHYRSADAQEGRLLLYAHGGGWVTGDLDYADEICRFLALRARCSVVSVDYRLAPEHPFPAGLDDVTAALAWALAAEPAGVVGVAGDSAGANLVAAAVQRVLDGPGAVRPPSFQVLTYPVLDQDTGRPSYVEHERAFPTGAAEMHWFFDHYLPDGSARARPEVAPLRHPGLAATPPTHVVIAGHDPLRDEARAYVARLRAAGVPVTSAEHATLCHGFLRLTGASAAARAARDQLVERVATLFDTAPKPAAPPTIAQNPDYDSATPTPGAAVTDEPEGEDR